MTESVHGLPSLVTAGLTVAVVPPPLKGSRWHSVLEASDEGGSGQLVRLSGISDIGAARELVGRRLLARKDDLPEGFELHDADALVGREVVDEGRHLRGTLEDVLVGPANDVWHVKLLDGDRQCTYEYYLPVIDEVVCEVPASGPIALHVPAGLEPEHVWQQEPAQPDAASGVDGA